MRKNKMQWWKTISCFDFQTLISQNYTQFQGIINTPFEVMPLHITQNDISKSIQEYLKKTNTPLSSIMNARDFYTPGGNYQYNSGLYHSLLPASLADLRSSYRRKNIFQFYFAFVYFRTPNLMVPFSRSSKLTLTLKVAISNFVRDSLWPSINTVFLLKLWKGFTANCAK